MWVFIMYPLTGEVQSNGQALDLWLVSINTVAPTRMVSRTVNDSAKKKKKTVNVILVSLAAKASYIRPSAVKKIIYSVTKTCPELQALKEGCWGEL